MHLFCILKPARNVKSCASSVRSRYDGESVRSWEPVTVLSTSRGRRVNSSPESFPTLWHRRFSPPYSREQRKNINYAHVNAALRKCGVVWQLSVRRGLSYPFASNRSGTVSNCHGAGWTETDRFSIDLDSSNGNWVRHLHLQWSPSIWRSIKDCP